MSVITQHLLEDVVSAESLGCCSGPITPIMDAGQKWDLEDVSIMFNNSSCNNNKNQLHFLSCMQSASGLTLHTSDLESLP